MHVNISAGKLSVGVLTITVIVKQCLSIVIL